MSSDPASRTGTRIVNALIVLTLLGNMSLQIILPAMPAIQTAFAASTAGVHLLVSLSFFVFGFAMLIYGPLADSYGRRPVYLIGMIVYTIGNVVCALAPSLPLLILGRVIASAGSSVTMVLSRAIVRDMFEGHETAAVLARIALVAAVAPMIAPPIGGLISDTLGWRALFLLLAGVGAISLALVMFALPETLREPSRRFGVRGMARSFTTLLKDRRYTAYAFNGAFVASIFFVYMTTAPFVYIGVLGVTATTYALAYMTTIGGFLVGYAIAARAAGRVSIDRMLVLGTSCSLAASCVALAVTASGWWTLWSLTVPVIALTIANGTVTPTNQAAVVSGDPRTVGAASGLAGFLQMMVGAILIQAVGALPHSTPYPMSIAMVLSGAAGLAAVVWGLRPRMAG